MFDERFNYVSSSSGFEQVGSSNTFTTHTQTNLPINKNGYLYVYVSNETPNIDVFFDNLQVTHVRGPLLEETHYYPFGERAFGICSEALNFGNGGSQKKKYNGIEKENDLSLEIYDAPLRELDGQIGRWWEVDPKTENTEMWSPYASNNDNPIIYSDPLGDEAYCCNGSGALRVEIKTQKLAGAAEVIGGGPEDPVADIAAVAIEIGGGIAAAWTFLTSSEPTQAVAVSPTSSNATTVAPAWIPTWKPQGVTAPVAHPGTTTTTTKPAVTTNTTAKGVIYKVPGGRTESGRPYVGRTKHDDAAKRGSRDGRNRKTEDKIDDYDSNNVQEGRTKEQKAIDKEGLNKLDNKRNEIKKIIKKD